MRVRCDFTAKLTGNLCNPCNSFTWDASQARNGSMGFQWELGHDFPNWSMPMMIMMVCAWDHPPSVISNIPPVKPFSPSIYNLTTLRVWSVIMAQKLRLVGPMHGLGTTWHFCWNRRDLCHAGMAIYLNFNYCMEFSKGSTGELRGPKCLKRNEAQFQPNWCDKHWNSLQINILNQFYCAGAPLWRFIHHCTNTQLRSGSLFGSRLGSQCGHSGLFRESRC